MGGVLGRAERRQGYGNEATRQRANLIELAMAGLVGVGAQEQLSAGSQVLVADGDSPVDGR